MNSPSAPSRRRRLPAMVALLVAAATLLAACGIAVDPSPHLIDKSHVPYGLLRPSSATTQVTVPSEYVTIFLDGPQRLVAVSRPVPAPASLYSALTALDQGPTTAEAAQSLESPISTAAPLTVVHQGHTSVTLGLTGKFTHLGGQDQIIAVAQLVYTVTTFPGITEVNLRIHGRAASVPTGNGTLSQGPLTRSDYASLGPI